LSVNLVIYGSVPSLCALSSWRTYGVSFTKGDKVNRAHYLLTN
jgi:hypothetical protein